MSTCLKNMDKLVLLWREGEEGGYSVEWYLKIRINRYTNSYERKIIQMSNTCHNNKNNNEDDSVMNIPL